MPVFTTIGTALFGAGTFLAGATAFVLKAAVGIGLSFLASALAGKPKQPKSAPTGVQGTLQAGGDVPRSFMVGLGVTAGSLVYANYWSPSADQTPNSRLTQVISISDYPVQSLDQVWVNGELVTLDTENETDEGYPVVEYRVDGQNYLWIKFYDGTQTEADAFLVGTVASTDRPYESTRVGTGIAYVIATSRTNSQLFTGFPTFKFATIGAKFYDPSKDTSVGGDGDQRWATPSTWGGDGDHFPAVQIYNLFRGIIYAGDWLYGAQAVSAGQLPIQSWIDAIAACRFAVNKQGGGTEAQYRSGGQITVSVQVAETIEALISTCHGRLAEIGGFYKLKCGSPGSASDFSIDDGIIISTEEQSFTPFFGLADTVNGITAKYPEPAEGWAVKVPRPLLSATYEAQAGNRRLLADVPLDFAPYAEQVQRLMKSALEEAQRARRHTFLLPPEYWAAEPGDLFDWTSARNGYEAKLFRVDGVMDRANLDVLVDVTEVDPADFDFDPAEDFDPPQVGPVGRLVPSAQAIVDWAVQAWTLEDADGANRRPAIKLAWDGEIDDVIGVQFEVRLTATGEVVYRNRTDNLAAASIIISQGLLPATAYQVRGKYIPTIDNRLTLWSDWIDVTTPDIRFTLDDFSDELRRLVAQHIQAGIDDAARQNAVIANLVAKLQADVELDKDTATRQVRRAFDQITAAYSEAITVAVGPGSALATLIESLTATVGDIEAGITAKWIVGATPDGTIAAYELTTTAENAQAGIRVVAIDDDGTTKGQVWIDADQFLVGKNGIAGFAPMFVVDTDEGAIYLKADLIADGSLTAAKLNVGSLSAISADLGTATAGRMLFEGDDGSIDINSAGPEIVISDNS